MFELRFLKQITANLFLIIFIFWAILAMPNLLVAQSSNNGKLNAAKIVTAPSYSFAKPLDFAFLLSLCREHKYQEVINLVNKVDQNPRINFLKGFAYLQLGQITNAEKYLKIYSDKYPSMNSFLVSLKAAALFESSRLDQAAQENKRVLNSLKPVKDKMDFFESPSYLELQTLTSLADNFYLQKKYQAAERYYELLIKNYEQTGLIAKETYKKLEQIYAANHNILSKVKKWFFLSHNNNYELAVLNNSISPIQLYKKAMFLEANKNYEKAYFTWQEFLQKKPNAFYLEFGLYKNAYCAFKLNKPEIAKEKLLIILKKFPDSLLNKEILFLLANIEEYQGNNRRAVFYYNLILNKYPKTLVYTKALYRMALLNYQLQNSCIPLLFNMAETKQKNQNNKELRLEALACLNILLYKLSNFKESSYFSYALFKDSPDLNTKVSALYWLAKSKDKDNQIKMVKPLLNKIKKLAANNSQFLFYSRTNLQKISFSITGINFAVKSNISLLSPIQELDLLSFSTQAQNELKVKIYFASGQDKRNYLLNLAYLYNQHYQYLDTINLIEDYLGKDSFTDKTLLTLIYPLPYPQALKSFAAQQQINPLLIAAILRTTRCYSRNVFQPGTKNSLYKLSDAIKKYQNIYLALTAYLTNDKYLLNKELVQLAKNDPDLYMEILIDDVKTDLKTIINTYLIYKNVYGLAKE